MKSLHWSSSGEVIRNGGHFGAFRGRSLGATVADCDTHFIHGEVFEVPRMWVKI